MLKDEAFNKNENKGNSLVFTSHYLYNPELFMKWDAAHY